MTFTIPIKKHGVYNISFQREKIGLKTYLSVNCS